MLRFCTTFLSYVNITNITVQNDTFYTYLIHFIKYNNSLINSTKLYKLSKNINQIIAEIQYKLDLTQEQIADKIGYSRTRLSTAIKENATGKILEMLKMGFADVLDNDTKVNETVQAAVEEKKEIKELKKPEVVGKEKELSVEMKCIATLINTNEIMARSHENLTKSHQTALEQNGIIANLLTAHGQKEIEAILGQRVQSVLELLANSCIGQSWNTREEGLKVMGNILSKRVPSSKQ